MSGEGKLAPIGPEMVRRNRRLIAERTGWPVAAVVTCEQVEGVHPRWPGPSLITETPTGAATAVNHRQGRRPP